MENFQQMAEKCEIIGALLQAPPEGLKWAFDYYYSEAAKARVKCQADGGVRILYELSRLSNFSAKVPETVNGHGLYFICVLASECARTERNILPLLKRPEIKKSTTSLVPALLRGLSKIGGIPSLAFLEAYIAEILNNPDNFGNYNGELKLLPGILRTKALADQVMVAIAQRVGIRL